MANEPAFGPQLREALGLSPEALREVLRPLLAELIGEAMRPWLVLARMDPMREYTRTDLARLVYGNDPRTIDRWLAAGDLPTPRRRDGRAYWHREDILAHHFEVEGTEAGDAGDEEIHFEVEGTEAGDAAELAAALVPKEIRGKPSRAGRAKGRRCQRLWDVSAAPGKGGA